jgi:hypothetical protein
MINKVFAGLSRLGHSTPLHIHRKFILKIRRAGPGAQSGNSNCWSEGGKGTEINDPIIGDNNSDLRVREGGGGVKGMAGEGAAAAASTSPPLIRRPKFSGSGARLDARSRNLAPGEEATNAFRDIAVGSAAEIDDPRESTCAKREPLRVLVRSSSAKSIMTTIN